MASRAISGKPGGGKSYYAVKLLLDELQNSERPIVTNLELNEAGIVQYLAAKGRLDIDVYSRITRITDDQVKEFWRYRGAGRILPSISDSDIKAGVRPDVTVFGDGVCYFLDELHKFLNSRQWASSGPLLLWYISQHRHFGDDVWWITQHVNNVDKQWRSVTQDYTYARNFSKEKFRGFTKGSKFAAVTYLEPFTGQQTPQESFEFRPDWKGLGACYHTSIAHGAADKGQKAKGLPVTVLFFGVVLVAIAVSLLFIYGPGLITEWRFGNKKSPTTVSPSGSALESKKPVKPPEEIAKTLPPRDELFIVGVPLQNSTAAEFLTANKETLALLDIKLVEAVSGDAIIVSGNDFQRITAAAEIVRQFDRESGLVTIRAVVGRLVRGKGLRIGLRDLLQRASVSASESSLSSLLASTSIDAATGIASFGSVLAAQQVLELITDFTATGYRFEVVSRPSLTVLSGQTGQFSSGREVPIPVTTQTVSGSQTSVEYKKADFVLKVRPVILPMGRIRVDVEQSNSDVLSSSELGGNAVPTLSQQSLVTSLDIYQDQVAYLGGIVVRTSHNERRGVPILGDIPLLSLIFGTKDKGEEESELVILLSVERHQRGVSPTRVRRAIPVSQPSRDSQWLDDTSTLSPAVGAGQRQALQTKGQKNQRKEKNK